MTADNDFTTTDLGLVTHLRTEGILHYKIKKVGPNRRVFHFKPDKKVEKIARDWYFHKEQLKQEMYTESADG